MSTSLNDRVRWLASAAVVVLVVLILLASFSKQNAEEDATHLLKADAQAASLEPAPRITDVPPAAEQQIGVDVIGAVQQPGVYYLKAPARVVDLVVAAGGLAPDADREQINLASHLSDGQQVHVPRVGDQPQAAAEPAGGAANDEVNINRADTATLNGIDGIGPATAEAIVTHRESNGPFKRIEDIQDVKGIGPALFSKIKDQITVDP